MVEVDVEHENLIFTMQCGWNEYTIIIEARDRIVNGHTHNQAPNKYFMRLNKDI